MIYCTIFPPKLMTFPINENFIQGEGLHPDLVLLGHCQLAADPLLPHPRPPDPLYLRHGLGTSISQLDGQQRFIKEMERSILKSIERVN